MSFGITTGTLDFERLKEIGQDGRNSEVFLAHDKQLDAQLVVKKIEKGKLNPTAFFEEAKKLYDSEHQNVVQIKYACQDSDHIYLAMPYYKNGSLKNIIDSRFLTVREIIRYSTQFLLGVNNIHSKKLIHFDIKPDNILISDANESLVSDFGVTKYMDILGVATVDKVYPRHIPPEIFNTTEHTLLYDIYGAGLTLYRMCNGNINYQWNLFPDQSQRFKSIEKGSFPNRKTYPPHIPISLRRIINKALNIDPTKRQQTALELINELAQIDSNLDWQFQPDTNEDVFILDKDDKTYIITVKENKGNFAVQTTKTIKSSGSTTLIHQFCGNNLDIGSVSKIVNDCLIAFK